MGFGDVTKIKEGGFGKVVGGFGIKKTGLKTVAGLEQRAQQAGLEKETAKISGRIGEDTEKIFSGGFISDVFDTLNALQHGVVGVIKGKTFKEEIQTRESFTKQDAFAVSDNPLLRTFGGLALDIAVDPLTYVPILGVGKAALKIAGTTAKVAGKTATKLPVVGGAVKEIGDKIGRAFIYRFGQDPIYRQIAERSQKAIGVGIQNMLDIARPLTKLDGATQIAIGNARKAGTLDQLAPDILAKAKPAFAELDRLGREAVNVGLLKEKTYLENLGTYMARLYKTKEVPKGVVKTFFEKKPQRIDIDRFKKRQDIPEDVREAMGEILEAGYPTAKSLVQLTQAVEKAKFFKEVGSKWGKTAEQITPDIAKGLKQLPESKALGELSSKFVPIPIFDDIQELTRKAPEGVEKFLKQAVATFKYSKVILNPATHIRNVMSNFLLNDFAGLSPSRVDIYAKAAVQIAKKGDMYKEAKQAGLAIDTFAAQELRGLLSGPEGKIVGGAKNLAKKIADIYQKEEEFAKMAQYIFQRGKGLSPDDAVKAAEVATFNYAQVTPFIRKVRESAFGVPFITFTYKATPQVAKTIITKPGKVRKIGKLKNAIENQSDIEELKKERAVEPQWIREGFYIKLPQKDKHGRSAYLDLTYILPFGDLIAGNYFERAISRETGLPESVPSAIAGKFAFVDIARRIWKNQDFFGNKVFKESDNPEKQIWDVSKYIIKTFAPPAVADAIPSGYRIGGEKAPSKFQKIGEEGRREEVEQGRFGRRTQLQELLGYTGLKISPFDLETQAGYSEKDKIKALTTLLLERGEIREFKSPFVPKELKEGGF